MPAATALSAAPTATFDPNVKPGAKPNLPRRIGWSLPAGGELFTAFDTAVRQAADSADLEYVSAQANADSPKQFQQTQDLLSRGLGALIVVDLAPPALVSLQRQAIAKGVAVFCGPFAYSTSQLTVDQAALGRAQGEAAVEWINDNLDGQAEVALFNLDHIPGNKPRSAATRAVLEAAGSGIKLVSDVRDPSTADQGFRLTNSILQKNPDVKVWIGTDSVLGGTFSALKSAGKDGDAALFGSDGDAQALKAIAGGSAYKATFGIPYAVVAYAWGKYTADWLDGRSIPLVLVASSIKLDSKATIDAFNSASASPGDAFAENVETSKWFRPLGNTSYSDNRYLTVVAGT